ncbi:hypothetical protein L916_06490 [Phytophthora nicotianae]|uniref:FH2 domain-containing protein n=1 Tax=Phytophthora nicotianae TaxID=4792 RepID=W2J8T0_PHYNI|nr:hypothetical protein L916_06490 [Phytophthora nicotianae]
MGNLNSSEGVQLRFLDGCPEIPQAPAEDQVQLQFDELLLSACADAEIRDELNAAESIQSKWVYAFLSKLPQGSVAEEWLDPRECVELVRRSRSDMKCVHDLYLAIRVNIMIRSGAWLEKFVSENGIEELAAPLQVPGGASVDMCNEIISTLFVLANNNNCISALLKISECCPMLYLLFNSSSWSEIKVRSLNLLGILCRQSAMAQDAIMNAFSSKSLENQSLQPLVSKLEQNQSDIALQLAAVKFVNALLDTRDKKKRASICEDLKTNGYLSLLEPYKTHDDDAKTQSPLMASMIAQVEMFYENYGESAQDGKLGALRLALGDALNADLNGLEQSSQISRKDSFTTGNQGENDEAGEATNPEQQIDERSVSVSASQCTTSTTENSLKQANETSKGPAVIKETLAPSSDAKLKQTGTNSSIAASPSEYSTLDNILSQLQQNTKNLDHQTNEKLINLLQKLALTLSDETGASRAVDLLDKSLSTTQSPEGTTEPTAEAKPPAEAKANQEPDLLTRVGLALFPSMGEPSLSVMKPSLSVTKPPLSGRPPLFSGFGDFSLPSLSASTPTKSSVSKPSLTSFIGADNAARPTDSPAARGTKISLPFFQSSRKGPGLGVTPACTPIATASVRKDAKRPVFPSFPSPTRKETSKIPPSKPQSSETAPVKATVAPPVPALPPIDIAPVIQPLEVVKPLVIESESTDNSNAIKAPVSETDISKFRKLLSMGAPREAVRAKMQQAGVNPDLLDEQQGFTPKASPKPLEKATPQVSKDFHGPDVSKSLEAVKAKISQAANLLDQKETSVEARKPTPTPPQQETASSADVAKFKKLLSMGAPLAAVKAKMTQAGLDPALLDSPSSKPTSAVPTSTPAKTKVKDDPSYAKFFKLLSMGAPAAAVKAKMVQAGLNSDLLDTPDAEMPTNGTSSASTSPPEAQSNPRALLSNMISSRAAPPTEPQTKVKDDPQYAKFFKLLSMGAPAESVKAKMQMAGLQPELLDTPDAPLRPISSEPTGPASQSQVKVKDDPSYAKFFKLLSMGAPAESVKAKMKMAGLNPHLLDTPDATMPNANAPAEAAKATVKDDPEYAKFFKLLSMGAPAESVKAKMQMAGLKPELLDTPDADLPSGNNQAAAPSQQVKVKDDPAYAKFFKLLEMGAPAESVKAKMRMAGLQGDLLDTPDAFLPSAAPATPKHPSAPTSTAARRAHLSIAIKPAIKAKTRSFYWQQLKAEAIKGTIWEELDKEHSNQSNQDLFTLTDSELELLESEFPPPAASGPGTGTRRGVMSGLLSPGGPASPVTSPRIVFLIDRARSNNISIIVKQFRMSNAALRVAIMKMDSEVLTLDRVQGLIKILPTEEEIAAITGFSGDPTTLNGAELVLKELITVPRLKQRLSALETKHQFPALVRDLQTKINKIRVASNEIAQSADLKTILLVILQVGNKMNQGTARGEAKGFRLNDLTKLVQLKSVDKSVTLLHYVARMIRMKKSNVVRLGDSLASLYDVQSISIPELQGDMNRISDITESINVELAAQRLKNRIEEKEENDLFVESMTVFVDEASKDVTTLKKDLDDTLRLMRDIMLRFEKSTDEEEAAAPAPDTPLTPAVLSGAGEFFSIIYEFTMALTKADRENELKRIRDEKRLKQQELRAATPRRNAGDRAALTRFKGKTEATGTSNNPVTTADDSVKSGAEPETLTPNNATKTPETDAEKTKSSTSASEDQVVAEVGVEEKAVPELTGIPNTALKIPGIVKVSALPSVPASPLKKVVGGMPTGIPSPMKLKWTNSLASPTGKSANRVVPFDAASLNEIKSKLKTKHATNNEPQMRGSKPEVEGDGDNQDNNNNEPATPEKTLSEVEPSARVAVESDA